MLSVRHIWCPVLFGVRGKTANLLGVVLRGSDFFKEISIPFPLESIDPVSVFNLPCLSNCGCRDESNSFIHSGHWIFPCCPYIYHMEKVRPWGMVYK